MNSRLSVNKAFLQLKRGEIEKAVDAMKQAIEISDDFVSVIEAYCFLGEYYFVTQKYALSKEYFEYIFDKQEEIETKYDDLLNDEILKADIFLESIEKFNL